MPMAHGAGGSAGAAKPATPAWATPKRLLILFCVMCLFIYLDRGVLGVGKSGWEEVGGQGYRRRVNSGNQSGERPTPAAAELTRPSPASPAAGMIASNGVNGAAATPEHPASGIQGDFGLSLFQVRRRKGQWSGRRNLPFPPISSECLPASNIGVAVAEQPTASLAAHLVLLSLTLPCPYPASTLTGRPAACCLHGWPAGLLPGVCRGLQAPQRLPPHRHRPGGVDRGRRRLRPGPRLCLPAALPHGGGRGRGVVRRAGSALHRCGTRTAPGCVSHRSAQTSTFPNRLRRGSCLVVCF